jgi:ribokinase
VRVEAATRPEAQRRAVTYVDATGERTITLLSRKLVSLRSDDLPWDELADADAVYFTGGDADALRAARAARVLVATARELPTLIEAGVELDALVRSGRDPGEAYAAGALDPPPRLDVATEGAAGGLYIDAGVAGRYAAVPPPGPIRDTYGSGDSFAAGLTYALGSGLEVEAALTFASRCGALALTRRGAYGGTLVP